MKKSTIGIPKLITETPGPKSRIMQTNTVKCFLLGIELVKDEKTKEPFDEAGKLVSQTAFRKGLAWVPGGHILRISPPLIMDEKYASQGMDIIEEAITEVEKEFGYR